MRRSIGVWLATGILAAMTPLGAHHSIDAVYDRSRQSDFKVTITKVEWLNPHAHFWATVKENGKPVTWHFELGSPNRLMRGGWNRYTLKTGDSVIVTAIPARNGDKQASVVGVTLGEGKHLPNFDLFDR